jgi:DNA-binding FadR family transcriptional regulator
LAAEDYLAAITAIIEFHDVMVLTSENRALGLVAGILHDLALQLYPKMLKRDNERDRQIVRRRTGESSVAHGRLIDLISEGKAKEAETFWRRYMEDTAKWLARTGVGKIRISV